MDQTLTITTATVAAALYLWWGFRYLPGERWQILATVPVRKSTDENWSGINMTWYGLLSANAYLVALAVLLVLLGAVGVPLGGAVTTATVLLSVCVPASRLVARIVENKRHTFTVGGAVFVGLLLMPPVIMLVNRTAGVWWSFHLPLMAACAALAIAYAFGEGLGRLACISFGCCYGKPVDTAPALFRGHGFVFFGSTKKIAYADDLAGVEVVPVQALTAVLYTACGLLGSLLFLASHHRAAFLLAIGVTQGWRVLSETLRADYRGDRRFSAYQIMGVIGMLYAVVVALLTPPALAGHVGLDRAVRSLWRPETILFLQGVWLAIFIYTGRSTVTGATVRFHVHHERT